MNAQPEGIEARPLGDVLLRAASLHPDREAVVHSDARRTYADLADRSRAVARSLVAMDVGPGDHVGIFMANSSAYFEVLFGISLAGAVAVPMNTRYRGPELAYVVENADLKVLVTSDLVAEHVDHVARLHEAFPELAAADERAELHLQAAPELRRAVLLGGGRASGMVDEDGFRRAGSAVDEGEVERRRVRVAIRSTAMIMYTSGTTAHPKGCVMSHEMLVRNCLAAGRERFAFRDGDVHWNPLPMFHMSTILPMIAIFDAGATFLGMTHFDPGVALEQIEREGATQLMPAFPTITQALLNHPSYASTDLSRVRWMWNVAPAETLEQLQARMPDAIQITAYGCTEVGGVICINEMTDTLEQRTRTSGRPYSGVEVRLVDPATGEVVLTGERGEICVRGYSLFEGYYKDPERTAEVVDGDGWFHTGDVGALGPDGRVSYLGRYKDMLKVGGENVAAAEIEAVVDAHPAVAITQVVGIADDRLVEVAAAFVELRDGASVTEEELLEHCRSRLASFKVPRYVRFVDEWPMSATKIQKFRLRTQLEEELAGNG